MKLDFRILWFDDYKDYFKSAKMEIENLKRDIASWGFNPEIQLVTSSKDFLKHHPFEDFDLLVIDKMLEGYHQGEDFINQIRENDVFTDIIFYTANETTDLWKSIEEKKLEGVFVANRGGVIRKIKRIGKFIISKSLDVDNMRGIVVTEVGQIDHLLQDLVVKGFNSLPLADQGKVVREFIKSQKRKVKNNSKFIEDLDKNHAQGVYDLSDVLKLCDSFQFWRMFREIKARHMDSEAIDDLFEGARLINGKYDEEVLKIRNALAHNRPEREINGDYIFVTPSGFTYTYNREKAKEFRRMLLEYKKTLNLVLEHYFV